MKRLLQFTFIIYGGVAIVGQLTLLRELAVLFSGNELFIGFSLGSWLLWVGIGSWIGRKRNASLFPYVFCLLGLLTAFEIPLIRLAKLLFGFGMLVGPAPMMVLTFSLLCPIGLAVGATFSLGCLFAVRTQHLTPGQIYLLESIGSILGGLKFTFYFAGRHSHAVWAFAAGAVAVALAVLLLYATGSRRKALAMLLCFIPLVAVSLPVLQHATRALQWKGYTLAAEKDTRYSHVALARIGNLRNLFQDGLITAHFPDPRAFEETVHWAMLAHHNPKRIFLVGSGAAAGSIHELLKYPVERIDYCEPDSAMLNLVKPFLDPADQKALQDPRVHIYSTDGRLALKQSKDRYDVVLVNLPEPSTAQLNRFFTEEFFEEAASRLRAGGILALSIPSSENYLPPEVAYFNTSIVRTLDAVFQHVEMVTGQNLILLASANPIDLTPDKLAQTYEERGLKTLEVVPSSFRFRFDRERIDYLQGLFQQKPLPPRNRDFKPISYALFQKVWLTKFSSPRSFVWLILFVGLIVAGLVFLGRHAQALLLNGSNLALFLIGFATMVYEIVLLLAFQALHGYVYWQLGLLFAAFMAGLALGSGSAMKFVRPAVSKTDAGAASSAPTASTYRNLLLWTLVLGLALPGVLVLFKQSALALPLVWLFSSLLLVTGFLPGWAFVQLTRLSASQEGGSLVLSNVEGRTAPPSSKQTVASAAGELYAADVWGAAVGAVATSSFLIPALGLLNTFWVVATLLAIGIIVVRK